LQPEQRAELRALMTRLADGDRSAFDDVFTAALPPVRALARRMLRHEADADDAAQEALMTVFRRAADYDPNRDALPWIMGVAAWTCKTARRKRERRREVAGNELAELEGSDTSPEARVLSRELNEALEETMGRMSPTDRDTIAAVLEREHRGVVAVTAATFRKRWQRALERLRNTWSTRNG
jgi:RNA polymerase sigma factor (sigma-70 family)